MPVETFILRNRFSIELNLIINHNIKVNKKTKVCSDKIPRPQKTNEKGIGK